MTSIYRSEQFTWNRAKKMLYTEASTVRWNGEQDIQIRSDRTGAIVAFYLHDAIRDAEGEAQVFIFHPVDPILKGITVHLIND